ncbi:MAG: N-acetyltransferase family protein [Polyangiaceae bacterium]
MPAALRPARAEDLPTIVAIYNHAVESGVATFDLEPVTVAEREPWLAAFGEKYPLFVAELETQVVGFAYYSKFREKPGYLHTVEVTVYVDPPAQGLGVGSELLQALVAHARERDVHVMVAVLGGDNPASLALHAKAGFHIVGQLYEVGRKFGRWVDITLMQKTISAGQ